MQIQTLDLIIFLAFTLGTVLFGSSFMGKNKNAADYTKGGGNISGFVVGMSIFATYVSSISFLALPGNAFLGNWNSFVFSLSIPFASILAAKFFVPFYRNITSVSVYSFLEERFGYWARIYAASLEYFRGGGYSSKFLTRAGMPLIMCRLNLVKGIGPVLQIAEGWSATFPDEVFKTIDNRTDKTWPSTFFVPRLIGASRFKDVYSVMNYWGANHGVISFGHIGADLISLASMLSIPVCMPNILYYGRGPGENYSDWKSGTDIGIYKQKVSEQAYPNI